MELEELRNQIKEIDELKASGAITEEKAQMWKDRIVAKFELEYIPKEPEKELPNDLAHLPGRLVGKMIKGLGNMGERMAQNSADRIAQIERDRTIGSAGKSGKKKDKKEEKRKDIFDLPEIYR